MLPSIGSTEYRSLSFREQLEITALKLFRPDEYLALQNNVTKPKASSGLTWDLPYPQIPDNLSVVDLPVSVLKNYWAGYSCLFDSKWYAEDYSGLTPLDDYGIECSKMVNIWTFTLPLLCLDPAVHYIFSWLMDRYSSKSKIFLVLLATKVYCNLYLKMVEDTAHDIFRAKSGGDPRSVVKRAFEEYDNIHSFSGLNFYCPIVEECHELTWFEAGEFSLYEKPRCKDGRWFYPMIPKGLFTAPHFNIKTWQFLR